MKLRALFGWVLASSIAVASVGCRRNAIEAINLANDADKQKDVDVDGAISKYEQAAQLDPTNHRILFKLGMAYKKKEAWDKLSSTMARATTIAPKFANYWYWRGAALEMLAEKKSGSWEEAKEPLKKCIEADANYADCYHDLGRAYLWTDNEQDALVNYTKAIEHKPAGAYETEAQIVPPPPGCAYMAPPGQSNQYGHWEQSKGLLLREEE